MTSAKRLEGAYSIGWVTSLCLHAALAFGALMLTQRMTLGPQPPPFTWNVALVASPSTPPQPAPLTTHLQTPPLPARPMIRAWAPLPGNAVPTKVPTIEEPNPQPPEPIFPQTDDLSEAAEQPIAPVESVPLTSPIITPEAELPSDSVPPTRPLLAEQAPLPTVQTSSMAPVLASALRHDYAWLSETIMRRMQELKTYPADARLDRAEGKVVLKTVIRSDGDVERVEVFQSSGHHSLDQAAVELLHRAAPFQFPRPLEKPQVTVKIPLRYRLE